MANTAGKKIHFGIICGGTTFPAWQAKCIQSLLALDFVYPSVVINKSVIHTISEGQKSVENIGITRLAKKYPFYNFLSKVDKRLWKPKAWENISLKDELSSVPQISCRVNVKRKNSQYFTTDDIEKISSFNLDFILYCDYSILRGSILSAAKYGVWSFHHDDEQKYRGSSSGIWEIYNKDPQNGVILQQLTEKLDAGIILNRKNFSTINYSLSLNYDQLLFGSSELPAEICKLLYDTKTSAQFNISETKAPIYKLPSNLKALKLGLILLKNFLFRSPRKIFSDFQMIFASS